MRNFPKGRFIGHGFSKTQERIDIFCAHDVSPPNRGYVDDYYTAYKGNEKVGYLMVSYICPKVFAALNPTIWHFARNFQGMCCVSRDDYRHPKDYAPEERKKFFESALISMDFYGASSYPPKSWAEFHAKIKDCYRWEVLKRRHRSIKAYNFNKTHVAYSNTTQSDAHGVVRDNFNQGIGRLLYAGASVELDTRAMPLLSSTLRSDHATRLWKSFIKDDMTDKKVFRKKTRMRLMADKVENIVFFPDASLRESAYQKAA